MSQDSSEEAAIHAEGVSRLFGSLKAVDKVDLTVRKGEVFGFLGPNGAGKSTLIRMLLGLLSPSSGKVRVLGLEMPRQAEQLRPRSGYMSQRFSLYGDLSVEENLDFAAQIFGVRDKRRKCVQAAMEEYGLTERRRQRATTLSGGWRQRLALAAATIHQPELLVLDEPTAGVDPDNRRRFWEKLFELSGRGATILVSTHYMDEAVRCFRLCLMKGGRKVVDGSPADLAAMLSDRVLRFRLQDTPRAVTFLRGLDRVASVAQIGEALRVVVPRGESAAGALNQLVVSLEDAGVGPVDGRVVYPNMEDVFEALTREKNLHSSNGETS